MVKRLATHLLLRPKDFTAIIASWEVIGMFNCDAMGLKDEMLPFWRELIDNCSTMAHPTGTRLSPNGRARHWWTICFHECKFLARKFFGSDIESS